MCNVDGVCYCPGATVSVVVIALRGGTCLCTLSTDCVYATCCAVTEMTSRHTYNPGIGTHDCGLLPLNDTYHTSTIVSTCPSVQCLRTTLFGTCCCEGHGSSEPLVCDCDNPGCECSGHGVRTMSHIVHDVCNPNKEGGTPSFVMVLNTGYASMEENLAFSTGAANATIVTITYDCNVGAPTYYMTYAHDR